MTRIVLSVRASRFVQQPNPPAAKCTGKQGFRSPQQAWEIMRRRVFARGERQVYRCDECGLWHLGGGRQ